MINLPTVCVTPTKMKVLSLIVVCFSLAFANNLVEKFAWRELDFSWSSDEAKQTAIREGSFIASNNLPLAFDVWGDKMFLTVPRCESNNSISLFMRIFKTINYTFLIPFSVLQMENRSFKFHELHQNFRWNISCSTSISKLGDESTSRTDDWKSHHRLMLRHSRWFITICTNFSC